MKKLFISVGLAAAGTAGLQAAYAPDQGPDASRMWSLSGSLRGFYDNNYTTASSPDGSGGFEVSPALSINVPLQQTEFGMRFVYGLYYYQARANESQDTLDQTFRADLWMDHAFTERWQTRVTDTFLVSQNPELNTGGAVSTPFRTSQSYVMNNGAVSLHTELTRLLSATLNYQSEFYDYQNSGTTLDNLASKGASYAGSLNRLGNTFGIDFQWQQGPDTTLLIGYSFSQVNYTGNEPIGYIGGAPAPAPGVPYPNSGYTYYSDSRNSRSHAVYGGVGYSFSPNLIFSSKVGAQYADYYNDPQQTTTLNPYGNLSLSYTYRPGCFAEIGLTESMNTTDEVSVNTNDGSITLAQQSTVVYGSLNHLLTPKLTGSLIGQLQFSSYDSGEYANQVDNFYTVGINFSYAVNRHLSLNLGNNFDDLVSPIPGRGYSRNEVYAGVTATY